MRWGRRRGEDPAPDEAEPVDAPPIDVGIKDEMIRLGQFLKLANLIDTGAEAKPLIQAGEVQVNGEVELRRGRQLVVGDVVTLGGMSSRVASGDAGDDLPW